MEGRGQAGPGQAKVNDDGWGPENLASLTWSNQPGQVGAQCST